MELHAVHGVVQKQETDAAPPSPEQCVVGAMVWVGVQCVQEQAAEEPQGQQEHQRGKPIKPYLAVCGQALSDADTALQGTREWEH